MRTSTALACMSLLVAPSANAASYTWGGASSVSWATTGNWNNGVPGTGDTAVFGATAANDLNIDIGSGVTVNSIVFSSALTTTSTHSITAGTGSITINDGGSIVYQQRAASAGTTGAAQTISRPIVLSGSATFTNDNITGAANGDILLLSGTITGSGPITITGTSAASPSFVRIQANNTSTFTGSWDVRSGNLSVNNNGALGTSSSVTLNGGILRVEAGITVSRPITYASSTSSISFMATSSNLSGDLTLNSGVAATFNTGGGNGGIISGRILGDSTNNITVNHGLFGNAFTLSGAGSNTASGTTTLATGGVYALAKTGGATAVAGNLTVNPNTTGTALVRWDGSNQVADTAIIALTSSAAATRSAWLRLNGQSDTIGGLASAGSGTCYVENEKNATVGTLTLNVASGTSYTFAGILRDGTSGTAGVLAIGMAGSGTQVLSGSNTFKGGATVQGGVLQLGHSSALGTGTATVSAGTLNLGGLSTVTNAIVLNGGTLANGTVGVAQLSATSGAISASLTGAGGLSKSGAGTLTLSGLNDYSGSTTIAGGILAFGGTSALQGTSGVGIAGGARLQYTGVTGTFGKNITVTTASGTGTVENSGGGILTLAGTLSKDNSVLRLTGGVFNVTGVITGTTPGASDLLVDGTSTVTLSSVNTYDGPTFVNQSSNLIVGINNAIPGHSVVTLGNSTTTGTLTLGSNTNAIGGLAFGAGGGSLRITATSTSAASLTAATGTMTLTNGTLNLAGSGSTAGLYRVLSAQSVTGSFTSISGTSASYRVVTTSTSVDYQQKAVLGTVSVTNPTNSIITGGSAAFTYTVANSNASGGASLGVTGTGLSNVIGTSNGTADGGGSTGELSGFVFTGTSIGNQQGTFTVNAPDAYGTTAATGMVAVTVLDHATPGFIAAGITDPLTQTTLSLNFGSIDAAAGVQSLTYSLTNLYDVLYGAGLTAGLDFTGVTANDGGFASGLTTFNNLVAGGTSSLFTATFTPSAQGTFSKTFTLSFSDNRNLDGAAVRRDLTIQAQVIVVPEPGTIALAGIGIAVAGWSVARSRRRAG